MAETSISDIATNTVPFLIIFSLVVLLFGSLLYFGVFLWKIKDKSEDFDKNFLVRSFIVALVAALFVIFIEFIFVLLIAFSPFFKAGFTLSLMTSALSTNIWSLAVEVFSADPGILIMSIVMIIIIVLFNSLIMLEAYKVSFGWTTVVTWTAIGIYLGIDLMLITAGMEDGMAGIFSLIADAVYTSI